MAEKIEDLNLPSACVQRIIKEVLPNNISIAKDTKTALARAASVFILYVTSHASQFAQKSNRKTMLGKDVIAAIENLEFDDLVEPVKNAMEVYNNNMKIKKSNKQKSQEVKNKSSEEETTTETETMENEQQLDTEI